MSFNLEHKTPSTHISGLIFNEGTRISLDENDIILVVGPNNSGKSATLMGIHQKLNSPASVSPIIQAIELSKEGNIDDLNRWLKSFAKYLPNEAYPTNPGYSGFGISIYKGDVDAGWQQQINALGQLTRFFCHILSTGERLQICNPAQNIAITTDALSHPIHYLQRDDGLELSLSAKFRKAFGLDLVVHRVAGSQVPLHVGERPIPVGGEDRLSATYIERLERLPRLESQGDGMRSFAGILLATSVGRESIFLIDEPEAFLHPPQARLMGRMLAQTEGIAKRQIWISTHSADVVKGVLEENSANVKVIRIRRNGNIGHVRHLDNSSVRELWNDPLLRHSNILDGLFHEGVVICESDSDCRFYSAVLGAINENSDSDHRQPDLMFTHCGGKARLPLVIRALRGVDVPVIAVADFDVLADEAQIKAIVEALGFVWQDFVGDWTIVTGAINSKSPELRTSDAKREINALLDSVTTEIFPTKTQSELKKIIRRTTAWSSAKTVGKSYLPSGEASKACERLLESLRKCGLHVVEEGELESFLRTESGHGPAWANASLKRDLLNDSELGNARAFVRRFQDWISGGV